MNTSAKLLSGVALLLSLTGYASAGAMDELKASVSSDKDSGLTVSIPAPTSAAAPVLKTAGDAVYQYLTRVAQFHVAEFADELFYDDGVMAVNIALDTTLKLPARPIVAELSSYSNGFTVMCSGVAADLPSTNWKTLKEYKAVQSELPVAISFLTENGKLGNNLLEITRLNGSFTIKVKESPWNHASW